MSSSRSESFFATAPRGLEPLLLKEILSLDGREARAVLGGVLFAGSWTTCYRVNFWSRIASRVLWRIASFDYQSEQDIYASVKALDWLRYFKVERTLRVNVTAQKSPLKSLEFATLRIKDAVCDRFRDALGRRPDVERAQPEVRVHAFLEAARGTLDVHHRSRRHDPVPVGGRLAAPAPATPVPSARLPATRKSGSPPRSHRAQRTDRTTRFLIPREYQSQSVAR